MSRKPGRIFWVTLLLTGAIALFQVACTKWDTNYSTPDSEWQSAGIQTVYDEGAGAFGHAFPFMSAALQRVHEVGDLQFEQTFVSAPAPRNPGLGPIFNSVSCVSCHIADGRGKAPGPGETSASILFRVSIPGQDAHGGPLSVPGFGDQLQNRAILGVQKEADVEVQYEERSFRFDDGSSYSLRFPKYIVSNTYTAYPAGALLSPRVAAPVFGLGLLEAVSDADILSRADETDKDQDGISGRPNYVFNYVTGQTSLGRFGWKANQPSLLQQVAAAYNGDMGITTSVFPRENSLGQPQYDGRDDDIELNDSLLHSVEFYVRSLAVPARRRLNDPQVQRGKQLFAEASCNRCHVPDMRTAVNVAFPEISNQLIHPYTDLLLHDMGEELADGRPDYLASGSEWRTPPLWGIGLTQKVNGHNNFLHDGRARNLLEAVLWHGGEAAASRDKVKAMPASDRAALVKFLESL